MQYYLFISIHLGHFSWVSNIIVCICIDHVRKQSKLHLKELFTQKQNDIIITLSYCRQTFQNFVFFCEAQKKTVLKSSFMCIWNILKVGKFGIFGFWVNYSCNSGFQRTLHLMRCYWFEAAGMWCVVWTVEGDTVSFSPVLLKTRSPNMPLELLTHYI